MSTSKSDDLYLLYKAKPRLKHRLKRFAKERGIELTITIVGLFIGLATVIVSYLVGAHQEILQASRTTDSYFNGIVDLFAKSPDENQSVNLLMIARTEAIIEDLHRINKPEKLANIITFISNLNPKLFYKDLSGAHTREKYIYLGEINLSDTNLHNLNLENARLPYTNMSGCDLSHTNLQFSFLKKAKFENAKLDYVNFNNADLQGANLTKATIYQATFENANLENAIWINGIRCKKGSIGRCNY